MERQAIKALEHLADEIVFLIDPSEHCGYEMEKQIELRDEIADTFDVRVTTVANKIDLVENESGDYDAEVD
ncbi:MAG: GTP-binding protein, partial [Halobacteria archaeon]|nr:GTP-binding protein [Halobacteria archaeon]